MSLDPNSERQTVMATQSLDYLMNPDGDTMMLTSSPPPLLPTTPPSLATISPPPPPASSNISSPLPSLSSTSHQHHSLPSISSLMATRLEHELPPLQKRHTFK
ncbi:hypothetical protein HPULCUR_006349 [Helicostylum pulchrum]|uniref:Uncharacterized protein n=1 Tax=Helicostylum pulchrum TaxID=562976 RepID=A0ABP9Y1N1_9FUNG